MQCVRQMGKGCSHDQNKKLKEKHISGSISTLVRDERSWHKSNVCIKQLVTLCKRKKHLLSS